MSQFFVKHLKARFEKKLTKFYLLAGEKISKFKEGKKDDL